jgi:hypothetical protein
MIGCYDFCGHYEWTFGWLEQAGGHELVRTYWDEAIYRDSQQHATELIRKEGIPGMLKYWGHTLAEESPERGFTISHQADVFRIDFHQCPSRGFLIRNDLRHYRDYCDHCMGWTGPMLRDAGYAIDHEHNHRGQCWWEMRAAGTPGGHAPVGAVSGAKDARLLPHWNSPGTTLDRYEKANDPDRKLSHPPS